MAIKDELKFRPANVEHDLDFAYHYLFKPGIEKFVKELNNGEWPESRYEFFKKGFSDPDMQMITHNGVDVGCFCISNTENAVVLQRVYLLEGYQRQGIGQMLVGLALEKAHELKKPLELEVLENNLPAIQSYEKSGFVRSSPTIVNGWNRKFEMRHKDTEQYVKPSTQAAFAVAATPAPAPAEQPKPANNAGPCPTKVCA